MLIFYITQKRKIPVKRIITAIIFLLMCLFLFPIQSRAQASVTDLRWVTRNDGAAPFVRIVMDLNQKITAEAAIDKEGKNLEVILPNTAMQNLPQEYQMDPSVIDFATTSRVNNDLHLDIALASAYNIKDIHIFPLKSDPQNKKPNRLVIDIPKDSPRSQPTASSCPPVAYRTSGGLKGKIICIDPGHGGTDTGAIGKKNGQDVYEKNFTLAISLHLRDLLEAAGAHVVMTRETDKDVYKPYDDDTSELQARCDIAAANKADVFVCIHIDSFSDPSVDGATAYYYAKTDHDVLLAQALHQATIDEVSIPDRGVRASHLYVNMHTSMPSVLVELGYISNPERVDMLSSDDGPKALAKSLFDGLVNYFSES